MNGSDYAEGRLLTLNPLPFSIIGCCFFMQSRCILWISSEVKLKNISKINVERLIVYKCILKTEIK